MTYGPPSKKQKLQSSRNDMLWDLPPQHSNGALEFDSDVKICRLKHDIDCLTTHGLPLVKAKINESKIGYTAKQTALYKRFIWIGSVN